MNVFIIPSWYPSPTNQLAGIFVQEQARYLAEWDLGVQVGISLWGQENARLALTKKELHKAPAKVWHYANLPSSRRQVRTNLTEYFQPVLLWTRKVLGGNTHSLLRANIRNFQQFEWEAGKVDVIHAHVTYPAGLVAMHLSRQFKVPFVLTEHMGPFPLQAFRRPDGQLSDALAQPLQAAAKVIAVSPALARQIAAFGLPEPLFIPNVVDEDFFFPPPDPVPNPAFTFFALGSIEESKGIGDLLLAFRQLTQERDDVHLRIGGDGSQLTEYQLLARDLGLGHRVTWLGELTREEARAEFQRADAFALPSHVESFGVVFAEAIACGKPILATRCGGPEEIVRPVNGLLCDVGDVPGIAAGLQHLLEHRGQYDPLAIREDFMGRFSKQAVLPQLLGVYGEVRHRPPAATWKQEGEEAS